MTCKDVFCKYIQYYIYIGLFLSVDMQVGQEVYVVSALDQDSYPAITYDFARGGNPDSVFSIDHLTGRITLARELDHELVSSYTLRLIANDSVTVVPGTLFVGVTDENDNAPQFNESAYEVSSLESVFTLRGAGWTPPCCGIMRLECS